jgi:hypothetical protein
MKSFAARYAKRWFRRGETGQSIVILALGFIALLAMVGITTDVSILFARYTQLRRAVDSASIAAASQIRNNPDVFANVNLGARQFIEFHGLNPREVIVEICQNYADKIPDDEVCTDDQRKLVRVTAQIDSPTIFLRVIGMNDVRLQASAIAETAVLDVVVVLSASETMLLDTTYEDWAELGMGYAYYPPRIEAQPNAYYDVAGETLFGRLVSEEGPIPLQSIQGSPPWLRPENYEDTGTYVGWRNEWMWQQQLLGVPQEVVNRRLFYAEADSVTPIQGGPAANDNYNDPHNRYYTVRSFVPEAIANDPSFPSNQTHPRDACRVRFLPLSRETPLNDYQTQLFENQPDIPNWPYPSWAGFVPTYNFHGCCNDPSSGTVSRDGTITLNTGIDPAISDGLFDDLICQPYKQARDATRQFLERIDFDRGDRVALVNFARSAMLLEPTTDVLNYLDLDSSTHMMERLDVAVEVLNRYMGVMAEPNYYVWDDDYGWHDGVGNLQYASGVIRDGPDAGQSRPIDFFDTSQAAVGMTDYPTFDNCRFKDAALQYPWSRYSIPGIPWSQGGGTALGNIMQPNLYVPPWSQMGLISRTHPTDSALDNERNHQTNHSHDFRAQCSTGNYGAALRVANNALLDPETSRREGAVWVMVMLGDGAAAATDPVRLSGFPPNEPDPYLDTGNTVNGYTRYGVAGGYGYFGLCPYGTVTDPAPGLMSYPQNFPYCSDPEPTTRHFCRVQEGNEPGPPAFGPGFAPGSHARSYDNNLTLEQNALIGNVFDVDVGPFYPDPGSSCDIHYDADDYARDWADFVTGVDEEVDDATVLPTIFTIGFGLNFTEGDGSCGANVRDCLGEELLRYIADVGENFTVNMLYQQDLRFDGQLGTLPLEDYEPPSPCEPEGGGYDRQGGPIQLLAPRTNCGNYYNAPTQAELEQVFEDIASRMFMRLTR